MKIPKYIIKNIEQISRYAEKMEPLISEVEDWYDKQIKRYEDLEISDEEFSEISSNWRSLKEFDLEAIQENFKIMEEAEQ